MTENYINVAVPESKLGAVYALIGSLMTGTAVAAVARGSTAAEAAKPIVAAPVADEPIADVADTAQTLTGEVDAAGTPFDPARHTGTKVKSGLWRLKAGMARLPGEELPPEAAASQTAASAAGSPSTASATTGTAPAAADEDDEFAAFAAAAAPAAAKARTWADADLSKLTNQAAQKLGSPDKVKELIAKYAKAGETPHSRNIPVDQREAFAVELEKVAGIEYAG